MRERRKEVMVDVARDSRIELITHHNHPLTRLLVRRGARGAKDAVGGLGEGDVPRKGGRVSEEGEDAEGGEGGHWVE
jgi:hypothetical protein